MRRRPGKRRAVALLSRGGGTPNVSFASTTPRTEERPKRRPRRPAEAPEIRGRASSTRRTYRRLSVGGSRLAATGPRGFRRPPLRRGAHTGCSRGVLPRQTSFVRPCVPTLHSEAHRASRAYRSFCLCPRGIRHQVRLRPSIPPSVRLGLSRTSRARFTPSRRRASAICTTGAQEARPTRDHRRWRRYARASTAWHSSATAKARPSARKRRPTAPSPSSVDAAAAGAGRSYRQLPPVHSASSNQSLIVFSRVFAAQALCIHRRSPSPFACVTATNRLRAAAAPQ